MFLFIGVLFKFLLNKMGKRTILIISLILSGIALLYTVLAYFGLTRYLSLHIYSPKDYWKTYPLLEKAAPKNRVVITMYTTPKRLLQLKAVINSLLDQTVKVDEIALNLPQNEKYEIPKEIESVVRIYRCGRNYGDMTCLYPTLLREKDADTKIIYLDDRTIYGKDFIETIVDASLSKEGNGKAIYTQSFEKNGNLVVKARGGVLIEPRFVGTDIVNGCNERTDRDLWVSTCLKKAGTKFYRVSYGENYGDW